MATDSNHPPNDRDLAAKVASAAAVLFAVASSGPSPASTYRTRQATRNCSAGGSRAQPVVRHRFAVLRDRRGRVLRLLLNYFTALTRDRRSQWTAFARTMGLIFSTTFVSAALRGVIGHMVKVDGAPLPGLEVLRYSTALNYNLIGSITMMALGLTILAVSIVIP